MAKSSDEPLDGVRLAPDGRPRSFRRRGRLWRVSRVAEVWKDAGCWSEGEGEKTFFRLETDGSRLVEIYLDPTAGKWFLYRVYD